MANNIVARTTYLTNAEERLVRRVDDEIAYHEPDLAPLITVLNAVNQRQAVDSTRPEWFEKERLPSWARNSSTQVAASTTSTTITVADGTQFVVGALACIPLIETASTAPEVFLVTAKTGNVLTVTRNIGGGTLGTLVANGAILLLGSAHEEHAGVPGVKTTSPVKHVTYLGIERTPCDISKTAVASRAYGAPSGDRKREQGDALTEHKRKMNRTALWSAPSENLTGGASGYPIRTQAGIRSAISTNILDAGGILTPKKLNEFAQLSFRYGTPGKARMLLASPILKNAISTWALSHLMVKPGETSFGMNIMTVESPFGPWKMTLDWDLENGVAGYYGFSGYGFSLDMDNIWYLYLSANGENRDTAMYPDVLKGTGVDAYTDEILTEWGLKVKLEKTHAMLYDITDYMA